MHQFSLSQQLPPGTLLIAVVATGMAAILFLMLRMRNLRKTCRALEESEQKYRSLYEAMQEQVRTMACFDNLTGLPNRALFFDRLNRTIAGAHRESSNFAVLFLDLDRFKNINDSLGHSTGDQLLIEVTGRLRRHIRSCDTLARLGGDEFVVVATNLGEKLNATYIAQSLIDAVQPPFRIGGNELHVTTSIGISIFPDDGNNAEQLMKHADMAMYSSKEAGRNAFNFYSPFMNQKAIMRMEIEAGLRKALEREEFFLEFQPIMDAATGGIAAAEALLRWNHPIRGRVAPDQFIALAEETGLILPLGEWVLRKACLTMKSWNEAGLPPHQGCRQRFQPPGGAAELCRDRRKRPAGNGRQCRAARNRTYRKLPGHPYRQQHRGRIRDAGVGHFHRHRRLRHRLLLAELHQDPADRPYQDRPLLHQGCQHERP